MRCHLCSGSIGCSLPRGQTDWVYKKGLLCQDIPLHGERPIALMSSCLSPDEESAVKSLVTSGHARDQVLLALVKSEWQVDVATVLLEGGTLKAYYFKSGAASRAVGAGKPSSLVVAPEPSEACRPKNEPAADPSAVECPPSGLAGSVVPEGAVTEEASGDRPGYLVLCTGPRALRGPGYFRCEWKVLEEVLGVPEGQLAGSLKHWKVDLRKCGSRAEAESLWRRRGQTENLPVHF
jgi:hypothetical protein